MDEKEALLNQLRGVEHPVVSGVPAVGWWLLLLLLIVVLIALLFKLRSHKQALWKRQSQQELQGIRDRLGTDSNVESLSKCSALARKIVLAVDHREDVAALHGDAWLKKLDDICMRPEFSNGVGRLLLDGQYRKQSNIAQQDMEAILDSMEVLINSASRYKPNLPAAQSAVVAGRSS